MGHGRAPGVQHSGDADAGTQVLWIGGDGQHRLGRCLEQQIVDQRLVGKRDRRDLGRQREHDMEVSDRQQVRLACLEPRARCGTLALGTVPVAAGVVGDPPVPAVLAGLDMTAQRSGAAVLDRRHDLQLMQAQMPGTGGAVRRAGGTEDIGDLETGPHRLNLEAPPVRAGTGRACRADWSPRAPCALPPWYRKRCSRAWHGRAAPG